jgi:hypothetical protein
MNRLWKSLILLLLFLATSAGADGVRRISVRVNDVVYDPFSQRLYGSVPASVGRGGNSVVAIDPVTGVIGPAVFIGSDPGGLALSDNGQYLYVALAGSASIRRFDIWTGTAGLQFSLGSSYGPNYVEDMAVLPGRPESIVVSKYNAGISPRHVHVAVYDNGIQRPKVAGGANKLVFSASPTRLYGLHTETSGWAFIRWNLDETGIVSGDALPYFISGYGNDIEFGGGRIYAVYGGVYDPEAGLTLGSIAGGPMVVDAPMGRVYVLTGGNWGIPITLRAYDWTTFLELGSRPMPELPGLGKIIRWGADGLAIHSGDGITLLRTTDVVPLEYDFSLTLSAASVSSGTPLSGLVTLPAPAPVGGLLVTLDRTRPEWVNLPPAVRVREGETTATFPLSTSPVTEVTSVFVSAAAEGVTRTAELKVLPTLPAAPTGLQLAVNGDTQLDLAWSGPSDNEAGFEIQRKGTGEWETVVTLPADIDHFSDGGLVRFATYTYRVRALNGAGPSAWSDGVSAATGVAPLLQVGDDLLEFGSAPVGTSGAMQSLLIRNVGTAPLTITGITLDGSSPSEFAITSGGDAGALAPGESRELQLVFSPTTPGARTARLVIGGDAANGPGSVGLVGFGLATPGIRLDPEQISFDQQPVGTAGSEHEIRITNTGSAALSLQGVTLAGENAGDFAIAGVNGAALAPGEAGTIRVRFAPRAVGLCQAHLSITDNAAGSPHTVALTGTGTAPALTIRISQLQSPTSLNFGSQPVGTPGNIQSLTITNTGTAPLMISSLTLTGGSRGEFTLATDSGESLLAPGASRSLGARFTPAAPGSRSASLVITDNAAGSPHSVALAGTGINPAPAAPGSLAVRATPQGQLALTWTDGSSDETAFAIWRRSATTVWSRIVVVAPNTISYTDAGLTPGATYTYRVRATNNSGASAWTNEVTATAPATAPAAPTSLTVTPGAQGQLDVAWNDHSGNETAFAIWRRTETTPWARIAVVAPNIIRYRDTALSPTTRYIYRVRATNNTGASAWTNEAGAIATLPPLGAPANLRAAIVTPTAVGLTWTDGSSAETGFGIWRKEAGGAWLRIGVAARNATTFADTTARAGTGYSYRLRAHNSVGASAWSNEPAVTTPGS